VCTCTEVSHNSLLTACTPHSFVQVLPSLQQVVAVMEKGESQLQSGPSLDPGRRVQRKDSKQTANGPRNFRRRLAQKGLHHRQETGDGGTAVVAKSWVQVNLAQRHPYSVALPHHTEPVSTVCTKATILTLAIFFHSPDLTLNKPAQSCTCTQHPYHPLYPPSI
jgi:hypothetical protein